MVAADELRRERRRLGKLRESEFERLGFRSRGEGFRDPLEIGVERLGALIADLGVFAQELPQDLLDDHGHVGRSDTRGRCLHCDMGMEPARQIARHQGQRTDDEPIEQNAHRVEVGSGVHGRRNRCGSARAPHRPYPEGKGRDREMSRRLPPRPRKADEAHPAVGLDEQPGGGEPTVDDAGRMDPGERGGGFYARARNAPMSIARSSKSAKVSRRSRRIDEGEALPLPDEQGHLRRASPRVKARLASNCSRSAAGTVPVGEAEAPFAPRPPHRRPDTRPIPDSVKRASTLRPDHQAGSLVPSRLASWLQSRCAERGAATMSSRETSSTGAVEFMIASSALPKAYRGQGGNAHEGSEP